MSKFAPSASFEYLFYGSTVIFFCAGLDLRRQILTSKVGPHAERDNYCLSNVCDAGPTSIIQWVS